MGRETLVERARSSFITTGQNSYWVESVCLILWCPPSTRPSAHYTRGFQMPTLFDFEIIVAVVEILSASNTEFLLVLFTHAPPYYSM
jgi:hypothetical protein